jgi:hypothetical protein
MLCGGFGGFWFGPQSELAAKAGVSLRKTRLAVTQLTDHYRFIQVKPHETQPRKGNSRPKTHWYCYCVASRWTSKADDKGFRQPSEPWRWSPDQYSTFDGVTLKTRPRQRFTTRPCRSSSIQRLGPTGPRPEDPQVLVPNPYERTREGDIHERGGFAAATALKASIDGDLIVVEAKPANQEHCAVESLPAFSPPPVSSISRSADPPYVFGEADDPTTGETPCFCKDCVEVHGKLLSLWDGNAWAIPCSSCYVHGRDSCPQHHSIPLTPSNRPIPASESMRRAAVKHGEISAKRCKTCGQMCKPLVVWSTGRCLSCGHLWKSHKEEPRQKESSDD